LFRIATDKRMWKQIALMCSDDGLLE